MMQANKQWHTEIVFQLFYLPADGSLRYVKNVCGLGKAQLFTGCFEYPQGIQGGSARIVVFWSLIFP
nr:hypothetical protein [Aliamphritea spongicola]